MSVKGTTTGPSRPRPSWTKIVLWSILIVVLFGVGVAIAKMIRIVTPRMGETAGSTHQGIVDAVDSWWQIIGDPSAGFPAKDRVNIVCMGIDDNWTDSDIVYTQNSRTDTLFVLSLDLVNKKASVLSIPRDSYVPIAGTDYSDKINAAYATGGPARCEATVQNVFDITPDYYVVLNIDATKKLVDALGGVDLTVEHQMDYDDDWGHLHVHLKPGFQHLDGDSAVAFARYRHGNHGLNPEDGDPRRIYRQHVLLRAMIDKAKSFGSAFNIDGLVDTAMTCVRTNLTRTQLLDLAALFHNVQQSDMQTAQLPGTDFRGPGGAWDTKLDDQQAKLYVDWLIRGDLSAARALTPVTVVNGTSTPGLARKAEDALKADGFEEAIVSTRRVASASASSILDTGVTYRDACHDIAANLGLTGAAVNLDPVQPNHAGWTPPAGITLVVGADYANQVQTAANPVNDKSDSSVP